MAHDLEGFPEALDNTREVAKRCNYDMEFGQYKYPVFQAAGNQSLEEKFEKETRQGLDKRLARREALGESLSAEARKEYKDRLTYELKTIKEMGFAGYFLIVADFIDYARR